MDGSRAYIVLIGGDGGYSGVPTYLAQTMQALSGQARVDVLSDRNRGGYDFVTRLGGHHVELAGLRTSISPLRALRALRGLSRQIDADTPDLVWAHARMAVLLLRVLAIWRQFRGRPLPPVAITFHGLPFGRGHRRMSGALARHLEAGFLHLMPPHHLVFLSQAAAHRFASGIGADGALARHHLHVLENCSCLDPLPLRTPKGPPMIVMTGRSGYQKDHMAAARLFAHLPGDCQLVLCGGGTDHPAFRRRFVRASGLPPDDIDRRVRFVGPRGDIRPLLQEADLFLLTSRYEGMPIAALEAFEAGLPLATTDIPGMAEIVAAHPMAITFQADQPAKAAVRIMDLINAARRNHPASATRIRTAWAQRFSFPLWQGRMTGLVTGMLRPAGPKAAKRP